MNRFTLYGLLQYMPTLFDDVEVPADLDKNLIIETIIEKSGDLYTYYQVPTRVKNQITSWFKKHFHGFDCMIKALLLEYNPIENTDRHEDEITHNDSSASTNRENVTNNTSGGSDTVEDTVNSENKVSAFDSSDYSPHDTSYNENNSTTNYGRTDDTTSNTTGEDSSEYTITRSLHTHGNIGVTSNQEMVNAELNLRKYDIYDVIAQMFEDDILVQVY